MKQEVLKIIESVGKPIDASTIHKQMKTEVNLSTVYRALEVLVKNVAVNVVFFFDGTRYYYPRGKHGHFLLCRHCHEVLEFEQCAVQELQERLVRKTHYVIENHVVLFSGLCPDCFRAQSKNKNQPHFNRSK